MDFTILESNILFKGQVFNVRRDVLLVPGGRHTSIDVVEHNPAVTMVPIDQDGMIWFIRQYRHPAEVELLELPAGVAEYGELPEISAQRELREETGMAARKLERLGGFFLAPGYSTEYMHVYLATDLYSDPLPGDENEFLRVEKISASKASLLAESGQLQDSKSLVAMFWIRPYLIHLGLI